MSSTLQKISDAVSNLTGTGTHSTDSSHAGKSSDTSSQAAIQPANNNSDDLDTDLSARLPREETAKSTKIVSTLGPASEPRDIMRKLILSGVNIFRLNFSHGTQSEKAAVITQIRALSAETHHNVGILADLQGPKFRLGEFEGHKAIELRKGQQITFKSGELQAVGNENVLSTGTKHAHVLIKHLQVGHRIMINDGAVVLKVLQRVSEQEIKCVVLVGGPVGEKKGINVPDLQVPLPAVTDKDREDAIFALKHDVEYLALSFVQRPEDVLDLRKIIDENKVAGSVPPKIIAKIEKPQAFNCIDQIIDVVDGIMVARGDLGVEASFEKVPTYQKLLIHKCNAAGKPVITATQMLESMISQPTPTRAEASDIANAVFDGTDAVMLSGETASGKYPVEAVQAMTIISVEAEHTLFTKKPDADKFEYAIARSAVAAATSGVSAHALVLVCVNYDMGLYMSKLRPSCPIIVITFSQKLAAQLDLCFGIHSIVIAEPAASIGTDNFLVEVENAITTKQWLKPGDVYVFVCADAPLIGLKNSLQLSRFGEAKKHISSGTSNAKSKWTSLISEYQAKFPKTQGAKVPITESAPAKSILAPITGEHVIQTPTQQAIV